MPQFSKINRPFRSWVSSIDFFPKLFSRAVKALKMCLRFSAWGELFVLLAAS